MKAKRIFIDNFASNLQPRDYGAELAVLAEVKSGGRFSTFELSEAPRLVATLKRLEAAGKIKAVEMAYPWCGWAVR